VRSLLLLALFSGAAALVYEVVWMRWFRLLFGSTSYAASATLCAFFAGLAIGSAWFGRIAGRIRRPLLLYGWLELGAALAALWVPLAVHLYDPIYAALYERFAETRYAFVAIKFGLALVAMLPSSILLGGTLPLLVTAYVVEGRSLGREGGRLYAVNVLGGAVGAALGGLLLLEKLGVFGTYAVGLGTGVLAATGAWLLSRRRAALPLSSPTSQDTSRAAWGPRGVAFASGFGVLAFQVLLLRALGQLLVHTVYTFGTVLVVVLMSLGAGALFVSATERRLRVRPLLAGALLVEAVMLLLMPWVVAEFSTASIGVSSSVRTAAISLMVICLGAPPLLVASVVFPLTFRLAETGSTGARVGGLLAANTAGGILGSLAASLLMLNTLGLWRSFAGLGLAYAAALFLALETSRLRVAAATVLTGLLGALVFSPLNPWTLPRVKLLPDERLLGMAEGVEGIVAAIERNTSGFRHIRIDGRYSFGGTREQRITERTGHLCLLFHPSPARVLFVGSASGGLAGAAVSHPVERIDLVEIVPEVHPLAAEFFRESNHGVHRDPRTRLIAEDGRNHLRAASERYDVVIEDLFLPRRPSTASLYSREHYRDAKQHLTEQGVFCQWLPVFQLAETQLAIILATFADVFPNASLWRAHFKAERPMVAVVGYAGPPPSAAVLEARARKLASYTDDRWITDPQGLWSLYLGPLSTLLPLMHVSGINTDDLPRFEFESARPDGRLQGRFLRKGWSRLTTAQVARARKVDLLFPERPLSAVRGGEALARLNLMKWRSADPDALRDQHARVKALLPAHLLELRDLSISTVWPGTPER
jgi:spermidine synthase